MKIASIETDLLKIPFLDAAEAEIAAGAADTMNMLLVRIETDDGQSGWGEAFGHGICEATEAAIHSVVAPLLLGRDATDINGISRQLQHELHVFGRTGAARYALSGIDIALWDLAGKAAGLPIYRLLGGAEKTIVPAYASLLRYGKKEPLQNACRRAVAAGYTQIKLHEVLPDMIIAAREAIGPDIPLMVDTNCQWSVADAKAVTRKVMDCNLRWLEEPVWPPEDWKGLAEVRRTGMPLACGENVATLHEFRTIFENGAIDFAQPSVAKLGLTDSVKVLALAEAHDVVAAPHCAYFGAGYVAAIHLVASMATPVWFERMFLDLEASPFLPYTSAEGGFVQVPQGAGLGCNPDPDVVKTYRVERCSHVTAMN